MLGDLLIYHAIMLGIMLLLAQSLAASWRAGMLSFAHSAYFGVGAYSAAAISLMIPLKHAGTVELLVLPLGGAVCAAVVGWLTGMPLSRLRGDYFVAATLILSQLFVLVAANLDHLGGALGFGLAVSPLSFRNTHPHAWSVAVLILLAAVNVAVWMLMGRVRRSLAGLKLEAVRDNPIAAATNGVRGRVLQCALFVLVCACAGFAGGLYLYYSATIVPNDFQFLNGLPIIICVVLSRARRTVVVFITVTIYGVQEVLALRAFDLLGRHVGEQLAAMRQLFLAAVLIAAVVGIPAIKLLASIMPESVGKGGQELSQ